MQVRIGQFAQAVMHGLRHRPGHDAHSGEYAGLEEVENLIVGIFTDAVTHIRCDVRRIPVLDRAAAKRFRHRGVAQQIAAVMAFAAMAEALDDIAAAVDLRRFRGVRRERHPGAEKVRPRLPGRREC